MALKQRTRVTLARELGLLSSSHIVAHNPHFSEDPTPYSDL